jgi:hypothetical protein
MLNFGGSKAVDFLPDDDSRAWVADTLSQLWPRLGEPAARPRVIGQAGFGDAPIGGFDELFDVMCSIQGEVGQEDVEFTLVEIDDKPDLPKGFVPLGNPEGQMMHTFAKGSEFLVIAVPAVFRLPELIFGSIAREIGRIAIHIAGGHDVEPDDFEAEAELAGIALGLGPWVANGAYVFENACCGGGCGIDLRSIRTGLSMPEACFATALDGQRKGLSRRAVTKHLASTQTAAFKRSWGYVGKAPELKAIAAAHPLALEGA